MDQRTTPASTLGITSPDDLLRRDPYAMYDELCRIAGQRHDPCLLDTFIAAVRFMAGVSKRPWSPSSIWVPDTPSAVHGAGHM